MFPAVNAWTFSDDLDAHRRIEAARAAGFEGIELTIDADGPLRADATIAECRSLAGRAADLNVQIVGLATAEFWKRNYASPEPTDRQAAIDRTMAMLDQAAALRAGVVLIVPAVVGGSDPRTSVGYADALQRTFEALAELRHEAEVRAVTIAIENVWNRFLLSPIEFADLIDRVNSPYVGAYFDTGNVLPFGCPADWIATLGGRIARVHAKDYDLRRPGPDGFCPLGEGGVDWARVVAALRSARYDGPLTYEGGGEPAEACRRLTNILADRPPLDDGERQ